MRHYGIYLAWLITLISSFFSLYLSEVKKIPPCELCWYLRMCLFPLVIILGQAAYTYFRAIIPFVIGLPIIGALISFYQIIYEATHKTALCADGVECTRMASMIFNTPVLLPILALTAFLLIIFFLLIAKRKS